MKRWAYGMLAVCVMLAGVAGWIAYDFAAPGDMGSPETLVFTPGSHVIAMAEMLSEHQVIAHPVLFVLQAFMQGKTSALKAGEYLFPAHISPREVLRMITSGKTVIHRLTLPEGLMTSEIYDLIRREPLLEGEITLDIQEGELLPETYHFSRGDKRNDVLLRMRHAMQRTLQEAWDSRAPNLPLATPMQALTLASIVEKETGLAEERPQVAAVYINRLHKGMLLQADPTTVYAITGGKYKLPRPLTTEDLAMRSPYNTYQSPGLPPGPIANPGRAAIWATLHPVSSDALYFVATGTGGHRFARTAEEHVENVKQYREQKKIQMQQ